MLRRPLLFILLLLLAQVSLPSLTQAQEAPPSGCVEVVVDAGFETDTAWTFTETPSSGFFDTTMAYMGQRAAFLGIPETGENQDVDSTVWQRMTLPEAGTITARMMVRLSSGDGEDGWYVVVWDLETDEPSILLYEPGGVSDWEERQVDLSPFAGKEILLVIGVHNDGAGEKAGLWVDEVHVMACDQAVDAAVSVQQPSPTATMTPSPSPTVSPTPTRSPTPTSTPTPTLSPTPTATFTATPSPTPTATATLVAVPSPTPLLQITPRPPSRGSLPDNNALPLIAAIALSGMTALIVVAINLRR